MIKYIALITLALVGVFSWIVIDGTARAFIEAGEVFAGPDRFGPDGIAEVLEPK